MSHNAAAVFLVGMMLAVVTVVEATFPSSIPGGYHLTSSRWHPIVCGAIIGSLQVRTAVFKLLCFRLLLLWLACADLLCRGDCCWR